MTDDYVEARVERATDLDGWVGWVVVEQIAPRKELLTYFKSYDQANDYCDFLNGKRDTL